MAAYCAQSDLSQRFSDTELAQLTDDVNTPPSVIDATEVSNACDEATSVIDAYLSNRYTTPLTPVPTIVRKWACDLAREALWKDRAPVDSPVRLNADMARKQLADVARGLAGLPDATGVTPDSTGGFKYTTPAAGFDTTGLL